MLESIVRIRLQGDVADLVFPWMNLVLRVGGEIAHLYAAGHCTVAVDERERRSVDLERHCHTGVTLRRLEGCGEHANRDSVRRDRAVDCTHHRRGEWCGSLRLDRHRFAPEGSEIAG